jgi:hypothetical protein
MRDCAIAMFEECRQAAVEVGLIAGIGRLTFGNERILSSDEGLKPPLIDPF